MLRIVEAGNYPASKCGRVTAAGLRVYPPGQSSAKTIPFPFEACSRSGPAHLAIGPVKNGCACAGLPRACRSARPRGARGREARSRKTDENVAVYSSQRRADR